MLRRWRSNLGREPSRQILNPLHLALDTLLEFFMLAARHRLLLPMCSRQLGHHSGWLLPRLPRSWVCRALLLGSDTTVTIPRHTQLYGNTFHTHFILTVAVLQSAAACSRAHHHQQQLQQGPIQTLSRRSMIADATQVRPPAAPQTKPRHRFVYVALVLYTNSLSFLKLISRVIGPHKKS